MAKEWFEVNWLCTEKRMAAWAEGKDADPEEKTRYFETWDEALAFAKTVEGECCHMRSARKPALGTPDHVEIVRVWNGD